MGKRTKVRTLARRERSLPAKARSSAPPATVPPTNGNTAPATPIAPDVLRNLLQEVSVNRRRWLGLQPDRLYNPDELVGRRGLSIYSKMLTDDQVKAALTLKKHAVLSTGWDVTPPSDGAQDSEVTDYCRAVFEQMEGSLDDVLLGTLSALAFGFSIGEICYRPITAGPFGGKIGLRTIKTRLPHDFVFIVDQHDNLLEDGIEQFGRRLPIDKFVIFSYEGEFSNWYGTSDLRAAYRSWWMKDFTLKMWGMFLDRYGVPLA